jgi:hypothetical protein
VGGGKVKAWGRWEEWEGGMRPDLHWGF